MSLPWPFRSSPKLTLGTPGPPLINLPFRLGPKEVATHKHVIGVTGQGKSKLLASMFMQMVKQGVGCALIDPHSDLAADVLATLLSKGFFDDESAYRKLLYVDFGRQDYYLPFNSLCQPYDDHSIARNVVETCKRAWPALADGAAPNFENILLASILVLVQNRRPITALPKLLTEKGYRDSLLGNVSDVQIVDFFHKRFDHWGKEAPLMIESTLRRVFLLTFSPTLRYSLGQDKNALEFRRIMDSGQAVIFDMGGLDEETQKFLGCLISVGFEVAALSRSSVPEKARRQYHLIMDEFSMFSAQSEEALARVLSLARKYGLYLTLAHQTWSQLSSRLRGALQNSIEIAFRLGRSDAEWAAPRFGQFDPYLIKHEVVDPYQLDRTHPLYFALQEQLESWVLALETLKPREAYVAVGKKTAKIRTLTLSPPQCTEDELRQVKDCYARMLMTPKHQVLAEAEQQAAPRPPNVSRVFVRDEEAS